MLIVYVLASQWEQVHAGAGSSDVAIVLMGRAEYTLFGTIYFLIEVPQTLGVDRWTTTAPVKWLEKGVELMPRRCARGALTKNVLSVLSLQHKS
ncbi:MAG TPA: hypothetical protein PKE26_03620 [Kiritimatiellia bacterium]|nr:hypothetical protein [Kiritimatiellia bacterium]HMO98179.1 hypothetical protein [Kiritimatiellia bacterium]